MKSKAIVEGSIDDIFNLIMDLKIKSIYDETFEYGNVIQKLPLETQIDYHRFKRILIISSRDMVLINKVFRV